MKKTVRSAHELRANFKVFFFLIVQVQIKRYWLKNMLLFFAIQHI